jgi:head-tail adaptor
VVDHVTYGDTVDVLRASSTTDRYGNDVAGTWATHLSDVPAVVQPANTSENVVDRDTVVTRYRLHIGPDTDITALDRIVWRGRTFDIDGDLEQHSRKGTPHHLEAFLRGTSG